MDSNTVKQPETMKAEVPEINELTLIAAMSYLKEATPERVQKSGNSDFIEYQQYASQTDLPFRPFLSIEEDITDHCQTENTLGLELVDINGEVQSLVVFSDDNKKPLIVDPTPTCFLQMGSKSHSGDWWIMDSSTDSEAFHDGYMLARQIIGHEERADDTVFVEFNVRRLSHTIRHLAKYKQINVITTADKLDSLKDQLKGHDVLLWPSLSAVTVLEDRNLLSMALKGVTPIHTQEASIPYQGGRIESLPEGLHLVTYDEDMEPKKNSFICSKLEVLARSRDDNSNSWGILLQWRDRTNTLHQWSMPIELLQGDSREYRKVLANKGLIISTQRNEQRALDYYLNHHPTDKLAMCVNRLGWHGDAFVMPDKSYGRTEDLIVYQSENAVNHSFMQKGELEQWQEFISKPLAGQSRIVTSLCIAFAGALLKPLSIDGGGFHIVGKSSIGKSISLKVASTVWGKPSEYVKTWNMTKNAAEGAAAMHNDGFLALDEISQADKRDVGQLSYLYANGDGKGRGKASGGNRVTEKWRVIFLSNGEETLKALMAQANQKTNAGMEVRLCHIDGDAGNGMGIFDSLAIAETPEEQAQKITDLTDKYYGTAGIKWLQYITDNKSDVIKSANKFMNDFMGTYSHVKSQANRVAKRFALVAAAGEIATEAGITGWQAGEATKAVSICFDNWLDNYGSDGSHEDRQVIAHIAKYLQKYSNSRFEEAESSHTILGEKAGYHRKSNNTYLFGTEVFTDICSPFDKRQVLEVLASHGLLKRNGDRFDAKVNLRNVEYSRAYVVSGEIINYDAG